MKSMLKADDFYVLHKTSNYGSGDHISRYFSVPGLMFLSDIMLQAVEKAGLEPSKVTIRVGDFSGSGSYNDVMSIAYPSPMTVIVHDIKVTGNQLGLIPRRKSRYSCSNKVDLADPNLIFKIAAVIQESLPKNSKYAEKN